MKGLFQLSIFLLESLLSFEIECSNQYPKRSLNLYLLSDLWDLLLKIWWNLIDFWKTFNPVNAARNGIFKEYPERYSILESRSTTKYNLENVPILRIIFPRVKGMKNISISARIGRTLIHGRCRFWPSLAISTSEFQRRFPAVLVYHQQGRSLAEISSWHARSLTEEPLSDASFRSLWWKIYEIYNE